MIRNPLLSPRCKTDCPPIPPCVCPNTGDTCSYVSQSCEACTSIKCTPPTSRKSSGGVSVGALAGAIVAVIIVGVFVILGVLYYRRRNRLRKAALGNREKALSTISPVPPTGLDYNHLFTTPTEPLEKPGSPVSGTGTQYNSIGAVHSHSELGGGGTRPSSGNPFSDTASVSTNGSQGTNVIPIAFVPPAGNGAEGAAAASRHTSMMTAPYRPERPTDLNIRLNDDNRGSVFSQNSSLHPPNVPYAGSQRSGMTASTMDSMMSDSSSVVYDQPVIVAAQGGIQKVLGVSKPEVVTLPSTSGPTSPTPLLSATSSLFPPGARARGSRPPLSPLASSSFTADDALSSGDPFGDEAKSRYYSGLESVAEHASIPPSPAAWSANESRPSSIATQNGTVLATVGNARRVVLGSEQPRVTSPTTPTANFLPLNDEIDVQSEAGAVRSKFSNRRSSVSSRADSILSSFAFVPPSPIANNHPTSPQGVSFRPSSIAESTRTDISAVRPNMTPAAYDASLSASSSNPGRHTLGISSTSFAQTSPSGLEHFSFQFSESPVSRLSNVTESPSGTTASPSTDARSSLAPTELTGADSTNRNSSHPSEMDRSDRASLDTLELSRSLAAYPLSGFDADGNSPHQESFQGK